MSRIKLVGRGLLIGLLAGGSTAAVCNPVSIFACETTEDCVGEAGEGAVCEINNYCSLPDEGCVGTLRRWHDRAANDIAGECVEDIVGGTGADDGDSGTATSGTIGDSADGSTSGMPGSTSGMTMPADDDTMGDDTPMTGDDMPMTDEGSSSGGAQQSCDDRYGAAPAYELCEETPDSCSFNAEGLMVMSCAAICEMFGGMCTGANLNGAVACTAEGASTCDAVDGNSTICICNRP